MKWIRKFIINLALIFFSITIVFIFLELILHIRGYPGKIHFIDSKTGLIILKRKAFFYWSKECFTNRVKTNSLGFHSIIDYNYQKSPNEFRIAVLGDSYVECMQVPWEKCFFQILENKLNEEFKNTSKKFSVYSFGMSSNGRLMNLLYYEYYAKHFKPDLVIDLFISNDVRDDIKDLREKDPLGSYSFRFKPYVKFEENGNLDETFIENWLKMNTIDSRNIIKSVMYSSKTLHFVYHRILEIIQKFKIKMAEKSLNRDSLENYNVDFISVDFQIYLRKYPEVWQKAWEAERKVINEFKRRVERDGGKYLLVSGTDGFCVHKELFEKSILRNNQVFDCFKYEKILTSIAKEDKINYLGLYPHFLNRVKSNPTAMTVFECDGHWNEIGHRYAGEILFEYLKKHPYLLGIK